MNSNFLTNQKTAILAVNFAQNLLPGLKSVTSFSSKTTITENFNENDQVSALEIPESVMFKLEK